MRQVLLMSVMLAVIGLAPALAQQVAVDYVEGAVDVRRDGDWTPVYIGERLAADTDIRLGPAGYAELSRGSSTVRLTQPGTYALERVLAGEQRNRRVGLGGMIRTRLERLGGAAGGQSDPAVAGVRGSQAGAADMMWVGGEEAGELINEGIELLAEEDYQEARSRFSEAYDFAETEAQAQRARFYVGYADYLAGDVREAIEAFTSVQLEPGTSDYDTWVLTTAQALVETFAYDTADSRLTPYLEQEGLSTADRQTALVLRGVAREGLGRTSAARVDLRAARKLDPDSRQGEIASQLLRG